MIPLLVVLAVALFACLLACIALDVARDALRQARLANARVDRYVAGEEERGSLLLVESAVSSVVDASARFRNGSDGAA